MAKEETTELRMAIQKGIKMVLEELEEFGKSKKMFGMTEMMDVSDMLKDMAEAGRNLAEADYYERRTN